MEEHNITSNSYTSKTVYCFLYYRRKGLNPFTGVLLLNLNLENDVTKMACRIGEKGSENFQLDKLITLISFNHKIS
jgi:hypothetical protein